MQALNNYLKLRKEVFEYFGYVEDWRVMPIDDAREYFWRIDGSETNGSVCFAELKETLDDDSGNHYENLIYAQRHLPKWVYRGEKYTMICVDTHVDGNQFLQIFSNEFEC